MQKYLCLFFVLFPLMVSAKGLEGKLADPAQETRAQQIFTQLRCMVCAGESIHDSNADLAYDLRQLVRERITSGESDEEVLAYIASRYGNVILMEPPVVHSTYLLWFGPVVFLVLGGIVLVWTFRHPRESRDLEP